MIKKIILFALFYFIFLTGCEPRPSDEVLLHNFEQHKEVFQKLFQALNAQKDIQKILPDSIRPKDAKISPKKLADYRNNIKKAGLSGIHKIKFEQLKNKDSIHIYFYYYSRGLSITGESKKYVYSTKKPDLIVENLDNYYDEQRATGQFLSYFAYRHIEGNWYLLHIVDD